MDQYLVAALSLVAFMGFALFAYIFSEERKSRRPRRIIVDDSSHHIYLRDVQPGPDNVETRSRRAF